jgi:hypothetical protein
MAAPRMKGSFCERTEAPRKRFDDRSFRWVKRGKTWLLIGCPAGKWSPSKKRCRVGTRAHKVLVPAPRGRCKIGRKIRKG